MTGIRVGLLHSCYWPEVQRGLERLVHELATDLIAHGQRPRLVTSHPGPPRRSVEDGLPIVRNWRPPEGFLRRRGVQEYVTHLPFSYLSMLRGDDDLAHAFFPTDAVVAHRWGVRRGRPSVFTYGGVPERAVLSSRRGRMRVLAEAVGGCDAVVALTQAAARAIDRWFGVEARVIPPGVRLELFELGGERDEQPTIACAAAPDDSRKRVDLLVAAFRRVRRERPTARLVLAPPRDAPVPAGLRQDGVEVTPTGPDGVAPIFQRAWASVLPSRNEAFGLVLVESLACGTPVVGTRDGGIPEIVDSPEIGRLFDGGEEELADALLETLDLAGDPATRTRCRERAAQFTTERSAVAYEELYRELIRVA